jgi:hypothetical protein
MQVLTADQLEGWMRYYALEPWGFPVKDLWHGLLTSTVANAAGAKLKPQDFMLGETPEPQEADQVDFLRQLFPGFSPPDVTPAPVTAPAPPAHGGPRAGGS